MWKTRIDFGSKPHTNTQICFSFLFDIFESWIHVVLPREKKKNKQTKQLWCLSCYHARELTATRHLGLLHGGYRTEMNDATNASIITNVLKQKKKKKHLVIRELKNKRQERKGWTSDMTCRIKKRKRKKKGWQLVTTTKGSFGTKYEKARMRGCHCKKKKKKKTKIFMTPNFFFSFCESSNRKSTTYRKSFSTAFLCNHTILH